MTLTGTSARFEMLANANLTSENTIGSAQIGTPSTAIIYSTPPNIAYSLTMFISAGDTLSLDIATGAVTGTVSGTNQVETFTVSAASGCTSDGICNVVVTGANLMGSPITVPVTLTTATHTTATLIRSAITTALAANPIIAARYAAGGSSANGTLTDLLRRDNDATLNVAIPAGLGITAALTSTNTTAGVGESKAYRINGLAWNQTDHEGKPIPVATKHHGITIRSITEGVIVNSGANNLTVGRKSVLMMVATEGSLSFINDPIIFSAPDEALITIDIHAGT